MDNIGFLVAGMLGGVLLMTTSPQAVFVAASAASLIAALLLLGLHRDKRPSYAVEAASGALRETVQGLATLVADRKLRLVGAVRTLLVFFEGAVDVLVVIVALDLLDIGEEASDI